MLPPFANETYTNFSRAEEREAFAAALQRVEKNLGADIPLLIDGRSVITGKWIESRDPADPSVLIARAARADLNALESAVASAHKHFAEWSRTAPEARARILVKAAAILRREKHDMSALMVREAGKSWAEADGDTAEAIDFLEFYAREMLRLSAAQPTTPYPGEENHVFYIPLGVGAIIPPWNFPCAILAGMTAAALVAGNTVVLKPASDTIAIGWRVADTFRRAGLPAGVLNFCPGSGAEIGDALVEHARVRFINFTGSKEVGLRINELAARTQKDQIWIKRVVAEMGGKDAIVVDSDFDLDVAADAIAVSAFGYQGQKCSACSRAIIHASIYDALVGKIAERAAQITVGPPAQFENKMGPVINQSAEQRILEAIEVGKRDGKLLVGGKKLERAGHFIQPTVFGGIDPKSRLAQEEIFGPVLACLRARDFMEAIQFANNTVYGLTGACLSNSRQHLEHARREFHAGNLYLNRKCTGALVDVHPFGGFNMSGTCSKAGGRDYLRLFLQTKVVSEKF